MARGGAGGRGPAGGRRPRRFGVDDAIAIAVAAHAGQRDHGRPSLPYVTHPLRVLAAFDDETLQMIAVLHDSVEDSDGRVTLASLAAAGAPARVVAAVDALTHRRGEPNEQYWARVAANPDARAVKLADIADNADEARLARLDPARAARLRAKYAAARAALGAGTDAPPGPRNRDATAGP